MDIGRALTFLFHDPRWVSKLVIAMLLNVVPTCLTSVGSFRSVTAIASLPDAVTVSPVWPIAASLTSVPLFGYVLRIARNVIAGNDLPLPDWHKDVPGILKDGLLLWVVITVWQLPLTILDLVPRVNATIGENGTVAVLSSLLGVAIFFTQPAAEGRLAASGRLTAGLDVASALDLVRISVWAYLKLALAIVVGGAISIAIGIALVMLVATPLGILLEWRDRVEAGIVAAFLLLSPYGQFALYHLTGQAYAEARLRGLAK